MKVASNNTPPFTYKAIWQADNDCLLKPLQGYQVITSLSCFFYSKHISYSFVDVKTETFYKRFFFIL